MANKKNIHAGHRDRMRQRYLRYLGADMEDHEVLEMYLYDATRIRNTNDTAHLLLERFGSMRGVFDADINELTKVANIGTKSAMRLKLMLTCMARYNASSVDTRKPFRTFAQISEYLQNLYLGETNESVYLLLFNNAMRLINTTKVCTGSVNDVVPNVRSIVETAYACKASHVILAHNHPGGIAVPSGSDIEMTYRLGQAMSCVGINFIDHFVVAENRCSPIMHGANNDALREKDKFVSVRLGVAKSDLEKDIEKIFDSEKNS